MSRSSPKIATALLLSSTVLSVAAASALLASCSQVATVRADPDSLRFDPSEFDGSGAVTHTTTVCYTGPDQVDCIAQVPAPFSLVQSDDATAAADAAEASTSQEFSIAGDGCHDVVVALAEPADLDERLEVVASGAALSGTLVVALHASASEDPGDGGSTDGGADGGAGSDGAATDGGGSDGGGTDGGGSDGGGAGDGGSGDGGSGDGGGGDTGPCPVYSGLGSAAVRTYETTATYESASGMSGTQSISVDVSDPAAPVRIVSQSLTDSPGTTTTTTERQYFTCDSTGSTLVKSEVEGSIVTYDGTTTTIDYTDTYSDGMISMVPEFGSGGYVSDIFSFEREGAGPTQTINGSNVVSSAGATTTATPAGSFSTMTARISYAAGSDTQDYTAYLDEDLGMVQSFYWDLVSVE